MTSHETTAATPQPHGTRTSPLRPPPRATDQPDRRGLYGLLIANVISLSGTRLSMIALPWFVVVTTGSAAQTGLAAFSQMGPYVLAKLLSGPLVDKHGGRRIIVTGEVVAGLAILLVPLLHTQDALPFWGYLMTVAVVGAASGPADGAKSAVVPKIAAQADVPLERVTGLMGSIERLATTVGAATAGGVIAVIGAVSALYVTTVTFLLAGAIIALTLRVSHTPSSGSYLSQFKEGTEAVVKDRMLVAIFSMSATTNLLDQGLTAVVLPIWAHETGHGPAAIGLIGAALGGAAVLTSLLAAAIGHKLPRRLTYLAGFMIGGLPRFVVLAMEVPLPVVIAVWAIAGAGVGFLNPIIGAVILERAPDQLVGRVTSTGSALAWAGMPFGGLVAGALLGVMATPAVLLILGGVYFCATTLPGLDPTWKQMDAARTGSGETSVTVKA